MQWRAAAAYPKPPGLTLQNRDCSRDSKNLEFMDGH
jgi:hypothetical protein